MWLILVILSSYNVENIMATFIFIHISLINEKWLIKYDMVLV